MKFGSRRIERELLVALFSTNDQAERARLVIGAIEEAYWQGWRDCRADRKARKLAKQAAASADTNKPA